MREYFLKTKVCIVGSGFCGYAAYKKLKSKNIDLIIVEGGKEETPISINQQNYYKVITNKFLNFGGRLNIENKLEPSFRDRKFSLGGSSECWSGWIKPFEESTYKNYFVGNRNQSWGDLSLNSFEKEVLNLLNSPIDNFDIKELTSKLNLILPELREGLDFSLYAWAKEPLKLKKYWIDKINKKLDFTENIKNKDLVLGYKLYEFSKINDEIKSLKFINESNNIKLDIEANYFILCMGGIENAKFVHKIINDLGLKSSFSRYIGNFQEHPHLYNIASFHKGENTLPDILTRKIKTSNKLHNSFRDGAIKLAISAWDGAGTPKVTFSISENPQKNYKNRFKTIIRDQLGKSLVSNLDYLITMRCEQTRHELSSLKFNSNSTYLNWEVNDSDFKYYSDYLRRLGSFLISNKFAKNFTLTYPSITNYAISPEIDGGAHHMSTVPYLKNKILINEKFQLSMLKNTYIVGSSSFPVSGFENPTHAAMATSLIAANDIIGKSN